MAPEGMSCNQFVELVTDYLDGVLSPEDRARFEAHLSLCDGCSIYLEQMRKTIGLLGHLPPESIPPAAQEELLRAFRDWKSHDPPA
jgi:anti-sigma factor RsiW